MTARMVARALDQFGNEVGDVAFIWSVLGPAGSINEAGVFTAGTKAGTYGGGLTVEVIQGTVTKRATARVVVEPGPLDHVQLEPAVAVVEVTNQQQFTATALDRFGNPVPGLTFVFRSPEQAGQVDSGGTFTAGTKAHTYPGAVTVEVTQGSVSRTTKADVTVEPGPPSRVDITPKSVELTPSLRQRFVAVATDRYGNRITHILLAWNVETGGGTIDDLGRFTAGTEPGTYDNTVRVTTAQGGVGHSASAGVTVTVITAVSAGNSHTCFVTTVGEVKCWGENDQGQLGDGTTIDRTRPVEVSGLSSGVATVSAAWTHTCALTAAGEVKCWGSNFSGKLGDGTTIDRTTPVDVVGLTSGVATVSTGSGRTCVLTTAGGVKCWGLNDVGQLGDGTTTDRSTPVDVVGLTSGVAAVSTANSYTCAVTTAGGVKCWGSNRSGQLGDGTRTDSATPVDVVGLTSGVAAISTGWGPYLRGDHAGRRQVLGIQRQGPAGGRDDHEPHYTCCRGRADQRRCLHLQR